MYRFFYIITSDYTGIATTATATLRSKSKEEQSTTNFVHTLEERRAMPKRKREKEDGSKDNVKYKGVQKTKTGRYQAKIRWSQTHPAVHISRLGKIQALGTFDTKEAAQAYDRAAIQAGHPPSFLNFPSSDASISSSTGSNSTSLRGVHSLCSPEGMIFREKI